MEQFNLQNQQFIFFGGRSLCKNLRKKIKYKRVKKEERRKNMLKREKK